MLANIQDKKFIKLCLLIFYTLLTVSILYLHENTVQKVITSLSTVPLLYLAIKQSFLLPNIYIFTYCIVLMGASLLEIALFELLSLAIPVYILMNSINSIIHKKEEELENFKLKVRKSIESEIEREIEKLDIKLQLIQRKLKEIFKLNTYTIKEITIDEMADRVVKGLSDLGYTGSVLEIQKYEIVKKEGFFPNLKNYLDLFPNIETVTELENKRLFIIPIFVEDERLGTLSVYSKSEVTKEEAEYLITYAMSIGTSIAKIDYFMQIIKLRELIYAAIESINIPLVITDANLNIEIANRAFLKFVGRESVKRENILNLNPELTTLKRNINNAKIPIEEIITITRNRKEYIYDVRVYPVLSENKPESMVFIIEDITERKEMEKQILHSEKLAVIGRLTASISHEIKNPLAIISQSAFSLKRKIIRSCDKEHQDSLVEVLERIERSTNRAKDIIDRLLNFSKPYYSKIESVNLKEVLQEAINLSILQTQKNNVNVSSHLKDIQIKGDRNSLIQLFINIIVNGIEAINSTGKVTIRMHEDKKSKVAKVSIRDTGSGIPQDLLDKIFEPFFTTKDKGTGLGLAVSYRIVKEHRGEISVVSKEGKGTEFIVKLPLLEEDHE
ncbi:MAG: ATP-binding protein [Hydrogenothermaceae bacterium]|nr:ATP-binding protein [Hydrogenothermaceae bacterium]